MIDVLIGGDVCPIERNLDSFRKGDAHRIFNNLLVEFERSDLSIVNLECPLVKEDTPIIKSGPIHAVSNDCINGLKESKVDVLCLANNHILDHGSVGLINTLKVCSEAGIATVGAGENLEAAGRILVKKVKGVRVGILCVAEHEFSIATKNEPGANPLDLIAYVRNIKKNKEKYDYLIVLVHAGLGEYQVPSPKLMEACRFMAEMGANAVICQASHCPGSYEKYEGSYLVYGQGNLIFDVNIKNSLWNQGFLVRLSITGKDNHDIQIIPFLQSDGEIGARKMPKERERAFLKEINERSLKLLDPAFVEKEWNQLCEERKDFYYHRILFGFTDNRLLRRINSNIPYAKYFYSKKHLLILQNLIRCESHREIIETIFEKKRKILDADT